MSEPTAYSVYIAAPYPMREVAAEWGRRLLLDGYTVTSEWLWVDEDQPDHTSRRSYAEKDLRHVAAADALILMTNVRGDRSGSGGRHVEFGYALALGKRLIVCGDLESVFHHLEGVSHALTFDDARVALAEVADARGEGTAMGRVAMTLHTLADRIREYWLSQGYEVRVSTVMITHQQNGRAPVAVSALTSDLVNGLPPGMGGNWRPVKAARRFA